MDHDQLRNPSAKCRLLSLQICCLFVLRYCYRYRTAEEASKFAQDYFWNYFSLGFDVLFDGTSHVVKKLVLHTNLLNHYLSMKFSRCNFKFEDLEGEITHSCTWSSIKKVLGEPVGPPVIFERDENPFGFTSFYAYTNCLFEVSKGEKIASVTLI